MGRRPTASSTTINKRSEQGECCPSCATLRHPLFKEIDYRLHFIIDREAAPISALIPAGIELTDEMRRIVKVYRVSEAGRQTIARLGFWVSKPCYLIVETKKRRAAIMAETILKLDL